jgi:hypothetical protein
MQALRGVTLSLRRGDRLMLVGANGSGKTTLIRLLHGLLEPAVAGSMQTHALVPEGRTPRGAMVFQRPFLMSLSVRWNVWLGLWPGAAPGHPGGLSGSRHPGGGPGRRRFLFGRSSRRVDHLHRAVGPVWPHPATEQFKQATGIDVRWWPGHRPGAGHGRRGDADVLFVHDKVAEEKFVADGFCPSAGRHVQRLRAGGPQGRPGRRQGQRHRRGAEEAGRQQRSPSSRAATRAAPTPPNCATGRLPGDIATAKPAATRNAAAAWARR